MILIDTSVWVNVLSKKQSANYVNELQELISGHDIALTRFQQLELLQGCKTEKEWLRLSEYLEGQDYLETKSSTWKSAARIFYELRKKRCNGKKSNRLLYCPDCDRKTGVIDSQ